MKKEEFAKAIMELDEEEFEEFLHGINIISQDFGWGADLDKKDFIRKILKGGK